MNSVTTAPRPAAEHALLAGAGEKRIPPVVWWAAFGALFCALGTYLAVSWLASGPEAPPPGPSTIPSWMRLSVDLQVWSGLVLAPLTLWFFVIRPWRREGRITTDGLIILSLPTMYWQNTIINMFVPQNLFNSRLLNWGSWDSKIPGWTSPHGERIADPLIWGIPIYIYAFFLIIVFGCAVMRKSQQKWPGLSKLQLFGIFFLVMAVVGLPLECVWIRTGVYIYPGVFTPSWFTLFDGHYYQVPGTEPFLFGVLGALWASARYFKDDKGRTIAERGVDNMRVTGWRKSGIRFLAFSGIMNLILLLSFGLPQMIGSLYLRAWPADVTNRSYFTNMVCGPGTDYACPSDEAPFNNRRKPVRFAPDGRVVVPDGAQLPRQGE